MARTHALTCEHDLHPRYCALCRTTARVQAGAPVSKPTGPPATYHPMPGWFRTEIERHRPTAPPEQPALDLEQPS